LTTQFPALKFSTRPKYVQGCLPTMYRSVPGKNGTGHCLVLQHSIRDKTVVYQAISAYIGARV